MDERPARLEYTRTTLEEAPTTRTLEYNADLTSAQQMIEDRLAAHRGTDRLALEATSDPSAADGLWSERSSSVDEERESEVTNGRISAIVETDSLPSRSFVYKPRGPHGAMTIIIGLLAAFPTIFISLLLSAFGYFVYRAEEEGEVPLRCWEMVDVLVTDGEGNPAEPAPDAVPSSNVQATAAAEPFVGVDTDRLTDLPWAHRKAIVMRVEQWAKQATQDVSAPRHDEDVFFDYLKMWTDRSAESDRETVDSLQAEVARDPAARRIYTERVLDESIDLDRSIDRAALLEALGDE